MNSLAVVLSTANNVVVQSIESRAITNFMCPPAGSSANTKGKIATRTKNHKKHCDPWFFVAVFLLLLCDFEVAFLVAVIPASRHHSLIHLAVDNEAHLTLISGSIRLKMNGVCFLIELR